MRKWILLLFLLLTIVTWASSGRTVMNLNGTWQFERTDTAIPPQTYSRTIPVPGLIHLAQPPIDQYEKLFAKSRNAQAKTDHRVLDLQYDPRYSWYRKTIFFPQQLAGKQAVLSIKKSKYVTQAYINGMDAGTSMECYTPIEFPITSFINYGESNEILIRVGERAWLPAAAAGSTDKEKVNYFPGIWDDVELFFTDMYRIDKTLILPSADLDKIICKAQIRNFYPAQQRYGDPMVDSCRVYITIIEKENKKQKGDTFVTEVDLVRDNITTVEFDIPVKDAHLWTPDDPFLYQARIELYDLEGTCVDDVKESFGMRYFHRQGKYFTLNGERIYLRGTNVTLHRFFEDPDCRRLPWDRDWVTRLLAHYPKQLNWNAMRVCVGIAPDFWYDIADSVGLMLQNEWLYWQDHGWDEQIRREYTNWVWSDGNHPSIVIWDAINENWNEYVGNELIPELKQLDPTRIWDAGYMTSTEMGLDEMDEPHPYMQPGWRTDFSEYIKENPYPLGDLFWWPERWHQQFSSSAAQLVNEYGWMWLWRDGSPSHLTRAVYPHYLGETADAEERWQLQAYWLQCQTEWLRVNRQLAGILAFCYLSDNLGFTGDWWVGDVADLKPSPALHWFKHCFAPTGVYLDVRDQRYLKIERPYDPGSILSFTLVGVTDELQNVTGTVDVQLVDARGRRVESQLHEITLPAFENLYHPVCMTLPEETGGYLLIAKFVPKGDAQSVISRRYIKVGESDDYSYYEWPVDPLD